MLVLYTLTSGFIHFKSFFFGLSKRVTDTWKLDISLLPDSIVLCNDKLPFEFFL